MNGNALAVFFARVIEGFVRPRTSASRLLAAKPNWAEVVQLAVLAFALNAMFRTLSSTVLGWDPSQFNREAPLPLFDFSIFSQLSVHTLFITLASGLAYGIGFLFGGAGSFLAVTTAVTWHTVVTAFLVPFQMAAMPRMTDAGVTGGHAGLMVLIAVVTLWLLASYIAVAHGFRRVLPVAMAIVGIGLVLAFVFGSQFLATVN